MAYNLRAFWQTRENIHGIVLNEDENESTGSTGICRMVGNASAGPIGAADIVTRGGQEWAQVDLFTNNSWATINAQCPSGICSSTAEVNGWDLDEWTWASIDEVQTLFNSFTGQTTVAPGFYGEPDTTWAPFIISLFRSTAVFSDGSASIEGYTSSEFRLPILSYLARVVDRNGGIDQVGTGEVRDKLVTNAALGAWFVRDAIQVPVPATLSLFGLGLASIWISRRKRAAKV